MANAEDMKEGATKKATKATKDEDEENVVATPGSEQDPMEKLLSLLGKPYKPAIRGTPEEQKAMNISLYGTETVPPPREPSWDQAAVNKLMNEGG